MVVITCGDNSFLSETATYFAPPDTVIKQAVSGASFMGKT
jgi:hypothetical protein